MEIEERGESIVRLVRPTGLRDGSYRDGETDITGRGLLLCRVRE